MKTALVLSAGGMYGAYQVGAWKALRETFDPDIVAGASIGAVNAWAIACDCPPDALEERWLNLQSLGRLKWQMPRSPWEGVLDARPIQSLIQEMHASFRPVRECGIVLTESRSLRPRLFRAPDITWRHLAASTAMLGFYEQYRIGGKLYSDGGLLCALPLWAAVEMGARRIVAINVLPRLPTVAARAFVGSVRRIARFRPIISPDIEIIRIGPREVLGSARDAVVWSRGNAAAWMRQGERDASEIKHSISNCLGREYKSNHA